MKRVRVLKYPRKIVQFFSRLQSVHPSCMRPPIRLQKLVEAELGPFLLVILLRNRARFIAVLVEIGRRQVEIICVREEQRREMRCFICAAHAMS